MRRFLPMLMFLTCVKGIFPEEDGTTKDIDANKQVGERPYFEITSAAIGMEEIGNAVYPTEFDILAYLVII